MGQQRRKEARRRIEGLVGISWQDPNGGRRFCNVRGLDLSESGIRVESPESLEAISHVRVHAEDFGFTCTACVRHSSRRGSKYVVGLELVRSGEASAQAAGRREDKPEFVDFYALMQLDPSAEPETIHRVFRILASRFHPDNSHTGDVEKFLLLKQAFESLSDPMRRAAYDAEYHCREEQPIPVFELKEFVVGIDAELNRRLGVLSLLYNRRRVSPDKPGLSLLEFERLMKIPREYLVFTIWYLKEKHLVRTESGADFEITADGVEVVESSLPASRILQGLLRAPNETGVAGPPLSQSADVAPTGLRRERADAVSEGS